MLWRNFARTVLEPPGRIRQDRTEPAALGKTGQRGTSGPVRMGFQRDDPIRRHCRLPESLSGTVAQRQGSPNLHPRLRLSILKFMFCSVNYESIASAQGRVGAARDVAKARVQATRPVVRAS